MSTFKATDKKKKREDDVFKATSRRTFDSAYIGSIENQANDSLKILNDYINKRKSGGYVSSKDMDTYEKAFKNYSSSASTLNSFYKTFGIEHNEEETNNWISSLSRDITNSKSYFSKFKNEYEYNDAVKVGELYDMSSAEILPHLDNSKTKKKREELKQRQAELTKQVQSFGPRPIGQAAKKYGKLLNELADVEKQISNLEESPIAYTTSSGQNITWQSLYDKKKAEEDFNALYNEMSAMPDWEENSQYKPTYELGNGYSLQHDADLEYEQANRFTPINTAADTGYATVTDEKEKQLFNYIAHTKGTDEALKWHKSREWIYKDRVLQQNIKDASEFAEKVPVLSDVFGVGASVFSGLEYAGQVLTGNVGEQSQLAAISSAIKGTRMEQINWEVGEWDAFDFLYGTGTSMAESVVSNALFGQFGGVALGLSAAASSTNDALNRGMSKGQAFMSGVASGIFEGVFETWSIGAFGDLTKNLKRADFRNLAKYVGKNMWNNAKEETLTEIANISYDYLSNGDFSQYETAIRQYMASGMSESDAKKKVAAELGIQVVEAAGSGALMGLGFGATGAAKVRHNITQTGRGIKDAGETRNLVDLGKSLGEGTEAYEYANKITDRSKAFAIGQLYGIEAEDIANANKGDIVKSLERKGYDTEKANNIADLMLDPDNKMFANSRGISAPGQTYNDIINNPNSTVSQRNEAYEGILRGVAENRINKANGKKAQDKSAPSKTAQTILPLSPNYVENRIEQLVASGIPIEQATQVAQREFTDNQGKMPTQTENAVESKFESNPKGKDINTANGKIITSKKLVASDKDNMAFAVTYDDDTTENVDAKDISFGNEGEALVYSVIMDMNVPVGVAETLIKGYKGNDVKSAGTYVNGVREAFVFGKYNQEADLNNGTYASQLTEEQRSNAFKLGKIYANEKAIEDTKAIVGEAKPNAIKKREGKLHFEGDKLSLTSVQDVSIENLKVLTMAIGKDIHIFESYVDENGKRVYKDANGNIKKAPNGFYNQADGSIWIDLNAGNSGQGVMMYTVAHELTHFIKQWSPTKFKALADFLVEQYGKEGVSVHQLVLAQQKKAKDNGREISYDVAFEEMVADSMETMLTDGKVIRELAHKDKGLFNKIKSWIDNLLRKLNKEYKNHSPESNEGQMLREMKKTFEEAQRLFADALVDASDNFSNSSVRAEKNTTTEGDVKLSDKDYDYWLNKIETISDEDALKTRSEITYLNVADSTPNILQKYGALNLPLVIRFDAMYLAQRGSGAFEGHYHHLGKNVMVNLLDYVSNPDAILKTITTNKKGEDVTKLVALVSIPIKSGEALASIEINTVKDIGKGDELYNLIVTFFDYKENYLRNLFVKYGAETKYKKETLSQDNPKLHKWLGTIEESVSKNSIPQTSKKSQEKLSDRDSKGNELSKEQQEYFKDSKVRDENGSLKVMYHGTPNATFTKFRSGTYFTEHKWYADRYQNRSASSLSYKKTADNPDTYAVYLDIKKPFDTRNPEEARIFNEKYFGHWGMGTPLMESGLPDWLDGGDLQEFLEEQGYDYDGLILDEGSVGGYGDEVINRGLSYVVFNPEQVKSVENKTPTNDPDIRYSERKIQPITETEYKELEKHFGTTGNFKVAGYLLANGKLLDFSGKHWGETTSRMRQVDHRDAQEVLNRGNNGINDMIDMIGNGNIRLMPEIGGINLAIYPNEKQRRVLSVYINYMLNTEGQIVIDYDSVGGDTIHSKTYGKTATSRQILNDIRNYFNGARQSELMSFHTMDDEVMYSVRDEAAPKKTETVYKLMKLGSDNKLYPLFIDGGSPVELGVWYNADSPSFENLKDLPSGYHLVDLKTGKTIVSRAKKPSKAEVQFADNNGRRWMFIKDAEEGSSSATRAAKQYGGNARFYYNVGINGSGSVSEFALRPGWHAGSLPVMEQIGNTSMRNIRADNFVWVEGEISYDVDYQKEAESNPSGENDIPFHIPKDGAYIKGTSNFVTKGMTWYIAGAFKANRIIGDREARKIVDNFNENIKDADAPMMNYDFPRNNGRIFNAETMSLEEGNEYEVRHWERARDTQKQKTLAPDDTMPIKFSDRVLMGSLFSGGGTLEAGLVYQMLDKEFAVEFNKQIASVYTDNHGKEHMFVGDVRDFNSKGKRNVFYLHASPVCKNFSSASHSGGETTLDITTAQATARVIEEQLPQVFTVENVKRYIGSEAYNIITNKLDELGYTWDVDVYKASNYGNATKRERMIIRAVKSGQLPAKPQKVSNITSWGEATRDLWDTDLTPSYLVRSKIEAIKNTPSLKGVKLTKLDKPLMIYDTTKSKTINYAWADELAPTLTTKCGDARIIMPDGRVYAPTPKFMGRIQGLPDDYKYPKSTTRAFTIIGNGIPTQLTKAVMGGVLDSAYKQTHDGEVLYSDRDEAPIFYSQMGKVVEGVKQEKLAANSVVNLLRGKGVKAEEIRWSGIVPFLEGKKSVTKQELLDFINKSMLQIGEQMSSNDIDLRYDSSNHTYNLYDKDGNIINKYTYNDFIGGYVSENDDEVYTYSTDIEDAVREEYGSMSSPRWANYKLDGGSNYREIVFTLPNSSYRNQMMKVHWGDEAEGVLVHARIQDFDVNGKKMLFIEEIQSDWHNEGHKDGYQEDAKFNELQELEAKANETFYAVEDYSTELTGLAGEYEAVAKTQKGRELLRAKIKAEKELKKAQAQFDSKVPDAPFKDNYHEFVLKRLIRMAAEQGYDSIGWTPAHIQSERWSDEFAEAYRIEYDQDMPKFLKKYGRQWGAKVDKTTLENDTEIWYMNITDSMKNSVLYEGQVMYSEREMSSMSAGDLFYDIARVELDIEKIERDIRFNAYGENKILESKLLNAKEKYVEYGEFILDTHEKFSLKELHYLGRALNVTNGFDMPKTFTLKQFIKDLTAKVDEYKKDLEIKRKEENKFTAEEELEYFRSLSKEDKSLYAFLKLMGMQQSEDTIEEETHPITSYEDDWLEDADTPFSNRDDSSVSTRSLLANALEGAAQNDIEKNKLAQYKEKIALIESEQKKLHELREKLFTKGIKGDERRKIQEEATRTANRINTYDRQLFNLESTTALKNVLTREKELARKRQKQKDNENLRAYKEKVAKTTRELLKKNRESRERAIEGRTKTEMRHKVKKVVNDLNNLLLKPTKERHVPEEMRIAVAEALALVNMDTVDADTRVARYNELIAKEKNPDVIASLTESRDRILNQGNKLGEKLTKLKDAYGMIRDSADDSLKSMYDDVIYSKIESVQKKVGKTPLRSMTLEQLESVYELYKMVLTTVRDSNKAFAEDLKMTRQALGSNTFAEIKENNKARDRIRFESIENFGWKYLKPMMAMKTIGSGILQKLWNNILYGQEVFAQDYDEAVKFAKEMKEKYGYNKWNLNKLYSFKSKSGKVMKINLEQMMSIYAYSKRKQADEHIEFGGVLLNESIIKEKKLGRTVEVKVNDSTAYRLDKLQVGEIIDTLEKEFPGVKDFVDEMQKYLSETMGEKGNEVSMKMYGIKLFKEEHYFPLKSSKDFMEAANAKLKGDVKIKNKGMTKSTVEHANNPIVLEGFLDVWGNHVNEMAMYHGLVLPLEDFSRTLNYGFKADDNLNADAESVRTALRSAFGESADNYLNELLKAINGGVLHDSSSEIADKMISKFKKAKVMASLSVIIQQPTAIIRAMGIIEPKYFTSQNFHHKQTWEELKKYCPTAIIKETGSFDTNMGRTIVDMVKEDRKFTEKVGDTLGKAPAWMDEMGWNMIWRALKKKVAAEQNLSGEALLKECGRQMTLIINETQVYDSVMSRNELMRSKSALTKMATAFMGEPTTVANMIYGAALDFKRGNKGIASKTVAAVISSVVINGLVSSLVYAFRDDDEEKTFLEKYLTSATTEVIDGLNPLTYIPFVKDAYSLAQGYDVERTDMSLIGDVYDALEDFYNVLDPEAYEDMSSEEIAKHIYENSIPLLTSICDMFGLPVGNILRDAEAIIVNDNLPMSKATSEGSGLAVKEGWLNSSPKIVQKFVDDEKYHKLYLIANNGDAVYVKSEVAEMVAEKVASGNTEKEAKQSVKSSFTSVYREEYKKAYKNRDAEEMNRIRKFLYATGLWNSLSELDSLLAKWREDA